MGHLGRPKAPQHAATWPWPMGHLGHRFFVDPFDPSAPGRPAEPVRFMGHLGHRFLIDPNDPWPLARAEPVRGLWVIWVIWAIGFKSLAVDVLVNPNSTIVLLFSFNQLVNNQ